MNTSAILLPMPEKRIAIERSFNLADPPARRSTHHRQAPRHPTLPLPRSDFKSLRRQKALEIHSVLTGGRQLDPCRGFCQGRVHDRSAAIADNLAAIRSRIAAACGAAMRDLESVTLVAVSKTHPAEAVAAALAAGHRVFGENRVQEAAGEISRARGRAIPICGCISSVRFRPTRSRRRWRCSM